MTSEKKVPIRFSDRFGWFWYNEQEIFHDTQADIDAKVKAMHDQGITHLITFSSTHFRSAYRPWFKEINACIERIVTAAHKLGMKVIEHHSAHLMNYPDTPALRRAFARNPKVRRESLDDYPGIIDYLLHQPESEAARWQISGETGEPVTPYSAHAHCFNNPDYRRDYLAYLEDVYRRGVDGIMTDDVQYYGMGTACACPVCRRKFREKTGYTLPDSGEAWRRWYGDLRDETFCAWLRFRLDSSMEFHRTVADHYHRLGLELIRPNYTSGALGCNLLAIVLDTLPEMDVYFQECCYTSVIRYSFPSFLDEQLHRAMVARRRGIPHMMMFYADRQEQLLFAWGVARLAGAMFTNTPGHGCFPDETALRNFEIRYEKNLFGLDTLAQVGFLYSLDDYNYGPGSVLTRKRLWMQACRFANIAHEMVMLDDPASWRMPLLVLNELGMMRDGEIAALRKWMENGGTLVVSGQCGIVDEFMRPRPDCDRADLETRMLAPEEIRVEQRGRGRLVRVGFAFGYPGTEEEKRALFIDNPERFDFRVVMKQIRRNQYLADTVDDRETPSPDRPCRKYRQTAPARQAVAELFRQLLPAPVVRLEGAPEGLLVSVFADAEGGFAAHFLNARGCFDEPDDAVPSHRDPVPFPELAGEAKLILRVPGSRRYRARLATPDGDGEREVPCTAENGEETVCLLDLSRIESYALLLVAPCPNDFPGK